MLTVAGGVVVLTPCVTLHWLSQPAKPLLQRPSRGSLVCDGRRIDHEIVYWRDVEASQRVNDKFLTFEYDRGGWNNVRMGVECLVVVAHATRRTLVVPPGQNLYLLGARAKDGHHKLGFADFYDLDLLRGVGVVTMADFLNRTDLWGRQLWRHLEQTADAIPSWNNVLLTFDRVNDTSFYQSLVAGRRVERYALESKRHVHVPSEGKHRLLNHFYAFAYFNDKKQRSFYRRLVRDVVRYKDEIQCAAARVVDAIRERSRSLGFGGAYYALHVRRGDFQYKAVKIQAQDILDNIRHAFPRSPALVYLATDDPAGTCENCRVDGQECSLFYQQKRPPPAGCPADPSWSAFRRHGWTLLFSTNFTSGAATSIAADLDVVGGTRRTNPNWLGHIETIVCSRASVFAGTWFSTFSGYIHRLRGYHGLGEQTYYHTTGHVEALRDRAHSIGSGYVREWRMGWTDDGGAPLATVR